MNMIISKFRDAEAEIEIKCSRLMTVSEYEKYKGILDISDKYAWWRMDEAEIKKIYYLPVLEIEDAEKGGLRRWDRFICKGYVFTVVENNLAVCDNFVGYLDIDDKVDFASLFILFDRSGKSGGRTLDMDTITWYLKLRSYLNDIFE